MGKPTGDGEGTLPYYAVERDSMTFQGAAAHPTLCPSCGKAGGWHGERFIPHDERAAPPCRCRSIRDAGSDAYAFDPATKAFLRRRRTTGDGEGGAR